MGWTILFTTHLQEFHAWRPSVFEDFGVKAEKMLKDPDVCMTEYYNNKQQKHVQDNMEQFGALAEFTVSHDHG